MGSITFTASLNDALYWMAGQATASEGAAGRKGFKGKQVLLITSLAELAPDPTRPAPPSPAPPSPAP